MAVNRGINTIGVSRGDFGVDVAVYGLANVQKVLRALATTDAEFGEVNKILDTEIRTAMNKTRDTARKRIPASPPMSGWVKNKSDAGYRDWWRVQTGSSNRTTRRDKNGVAQGWPVWDASKARAGIKVTRGGAWKANSVTVGTIAWKLESSDAAGTIYDKAGTKTTGTGHGVQFIKNIAAASGVSTPHQRVLWPAWMANRSATINSINASIRKMEERMTALIARLDNAA